MSGSSIIPYKGVLPQIGQNCFLAPGAHIIGDFICGHDCSFWFNTVVRADCHFIRMGDRTNVQDGTVIHVTNGSGPTHIGSDVTIGHNATLHACTIHDKVLIGMGAVILDGATISSYSYVAAGSLVSPGKTFPQGVLIKGNPATVARPLTDKERAYLQTSIDYYLEYKAGYR